MKRFFKVLKTTLTMCFMVFFLFVSVLPVNLRTLAAGIIEPTGNTEETETDGQIGPIDLSQTIGPIEPTGNIETDLGNQVTGQDSQNTNSALNADQISAQDVNHETVNNDITLDLNSGRNQIAENSEVDSLTTGQIDSAVNLINISGSKLEPGSSIGVDTINGSSLKDFKVLENTIPLRLLFPNNTSTETSNSLTGNNSLNVNNVDNHNLISFLTTDQILKNNSIEIIANTGENSLLRNTRLGLINTGDINLGVNVINLSDILQGLYAEINIWSILGGLSGNIILSNENNNFTGVGSINENNTSQDALIDISADTAVKNNNILNTETNTGENTVSNNSKVGGVSTGISEVKGSITNLISDTPIFYIINVFGKFLGNVASIGKNFLINQIGGPSIGNLDANANNINGASANVGRNGITGSSSINANEINNKDELSTDSNASIENNNKIKIKANTGRNKLESNTFVQGLSTGSINIISNIVNAASFLQGKIRIGIINIFGDWKGNLVDESEPKKVEEIVSENKTTPTTTNETPISTNPPIRKPNRVLSEVFQSAATLPLSGVPWQDDLGQNDRVNDDKKRNSIPPFIIPTLASLLLILSISGEVLLRKRNK